MNWPPFIAIASGWVAFFATGFIVGLCLNRADARRIPEHPVLRRQPGQRRLRVIEGGSHPYNWAEDA